MNITTTSLDDFRKKFAEAVDELENEFGIKISLGRITYNASGFRVKMEASNLVVTGASIKGKDDKNTELSIALGFSENVVGKSFMNEGKTYTVKDIVLRRRKNPISLSCSDGNQYKASPSYLKIKLALSQ